VQIVYRSSRRLEFAWTYFRRKVGLLRRVVKACTAKDDGQLKSLILASRDKNIRNSADRFEKSRICLGYQRRATYSIGTEVLVSVKLILVVTLLIP
jgi:hypothetical protein